MPKIVDHDDRRTELVATTWRIIARRGMSGATMREIAAEAGFANGAVKPYFPTKQDLLRATFDYVFERTNERAILATRRRTGVAAILAFGREVLPLDADRRDEARAVIAFWQEAATDPALAAAHSESMAVWRGWLASWIREDVAAGRMRAELDIEVSVEVLLAFLLGAQIGATLDTEAPTEHLLEIQLESVVDAWLVRDGVETHPSADAFPSTA